MCWPYMIIYLSREEKTTISFNSKIFKPHFLKVGLVYQDVVAGVEVINCQSVKLQVKQMFGDWWWWCLGIGDMLITYNIYRLICMATGNCFQVLGSVQSVTYRYREFPVPGIFHFFGGIDKNWYRKKSLGTGIGKIWYRKKYQYRYQKYLVPGKSIGIV